MYCVGPYTGLPRVWHLATYWGLARTEQNTKNCVRPVSRIPQGFLGASGAPLGNLAPQRRFPPKLSRSLGGKRCCGARLAEGAPDAPRNRCGDAAFPQAHTAVRGTRMLHAVCCGPRRWV